MSFLRKYFFTTPFFNALFYLKYALSSHILGHLGKIYVGYISFKAISSILAR